MSRSSSKVSVPSLAPFVHQSEGKMDISTLSVSSSHSGKNSTATTPRSSALEQAQPLVRLLSTAYKATTTHKIRAQAAAAGRPSDTAALSASSKAVCDAVQKISLHIKAFSTYSAVDAENVKGDINLCPPDGAHMPLLTQAIAIDLHGPVESEPIVPLILAAYQDSVDVNCAWDVHNVSPLSYLRQEMRLYSQDDSATLCRRAVHIVEALVSFSDLQVTTSLRFFCRLQPAAPSRTWERCMLEIIELLLHHPNCELNEKGLEEDSMYGMTALHACLRSCPLQLTEHYLHRRLQLLLKAGADVNLQYDVNGEYVTPLMMAFHAGLPLSFTEDDLVDQAAADAPAPGPTRKLAAKSSPDLFQNSALVLNTHSNVIPMLIDNFKGAPQQPIKVLTALLEAGASLNTPYVSSSELSGMTVAHLAVLFAAISHRTTLSQTKLSVLIEFGLSNELDLSAVDGQGRTPVQLLQLVHKGARMIRDDRVDLVVQLIATAKRAAYEDHVRDKQ